MDGTGCAEVCDDGNTVSGDGCSKNCLSEETCRNGILDPQGNGQDNPDEKFDERRRGAELVDWRYLGPFDTLPPGASVRHRVIPWAEVSLEEGTGIVHIAPGCGGEDFELGRELGLPVLVPVDEEGRFYAD